MSYSFDFGFDRRVVSWSDARLALFVLAQGSRDDFGGRPGALAIADASGFVELFEMQVGLSPLEAGLYAEVIDEPDGLPILAARMREARAAGKLPLSVGDDRRITPHAAGDQPLVAFWGKLGRAEIDENALFASRPTVLGGVRAATSQAFRVAPAAVAINTARSLVVHPEAFQESLTRLPGPVHLSIDLDVLSPGVAQCPRSLEPGGFGWYELMDAIDSVFHGPGIASAGLVGVAHVPPRSPAALLGAQILLKIAGLRAATLGA